MSRPLNDDVFRAVAHPVRRNILDLLRKRDLTPGEIVQSIPMTKQAISAHLRVLRTTNLVHQRRVGKQRIYSLHQRALRAIRAWSARFS